jgi:hypothetical protein
MDEGGCDGSPFLVQPKAGSYKQKMDEILFAHFLIRNKALFQVRPIKYIPGSPHIVDPRLSTWKQR